jgi:hypothetical protein
MVPPNSDHKTPIFWSFSKKVKVLQLSSVPISSQVHKYAKWLNTSFSRNLSFLKLFFAQVVSKISQSNLKLFPLSFKALLTLQITHLKAFEIALQDFQT